MFLLYLFLGDISAYALLNNPSWNKVYYTTTWESESHPLSDRTDPPSLPPSPT